MCTRPWIKLFFTPGKFLFLVSTLLHLILKGLLRLDKEKKNKEETKEARIGVSIKSGG